jgi:fructan beta-fructosidase
MVGYIPTRKSMLRLLVVAVIGMDPLDTPAQAPDVVIADFEGKDYAAWRVEGTAFGPGPACGTLPNQMAVDGFRGGGLVNSYFGGDPSTGRLTSPEFIVNRTFLNFLIGGGGWETQTCMNLLVDGTVVRTATGPNTQPGGSERLEPAGWDVREFAGKTARLEIVDRATGGWGHINVDQIVLSDRRPPGVVTNATRELTLRQRFLLLPVRTGTKKRRVTLLVDGAAVREFAIELADDPGWWAHLDVSAWQGRKAVLRVDRLDEHSTALARVTQAEDIWAADQVYHEPLRAQFHFSPRRGWNNDPNGMVFAQGEYHLYFQHNPYGWDWGNMHWGHAVSRDLVHWEERPIAIYPRQFGDWVFSGSAVVDRANTSGWRRGEDDLLVTAYTSTGRGECIAYSNDRGRTWTEFQDNPVVKHNGRDPRLLWYKPAKRWVIALYDEHDGKQWIAFHTSPNLKTWTCQSRIEGFYECPDLFELPLDGDDAKRKWVLTAGSSEYMVGQFDGVKFTPVTSKLPGHRGRGYYAAQTFSHDPKGRVVRVGWFQTTTPGMPFNQGMSLPATLTLHTTPDGPRLAWHPVEELAALRIRTLATASGVFKPGDDPLAGIGAELVELRAAFEPGPASVLSLRIRGVEVRYDAAKQEIRVHGHSAPAPLRAGRQRLIVYADRTGLEVFASDGLTYVPMPVNLDAGNLSQEARLTGDPLKLDSLAVYELRSIWGP